MLGLLFSAAPPPKLTFRDGVFTVTDAGVVVHVPIATPSTHDPKTGRFRIVHQGVEVRFGPEGLQAGRKGALRRLRLAPFASSPKLLQPAEIRAVAEAVRRKQRSPEPDMLSGYEATGSKVFLLLRWRKPGGEPWMEALAYVDTSEPELRAAALGRLRGLSFAKPKADDRLHTWQGKLAAGTNSGGRVGLATIGTDGEGSDFRDLGPAAGGWAWAPGSEYAFVSRAAEAGWSSMEAVLVANGATIPAREFKGSIAELLPEGWAKLVVAGGPVVANLLTGADARLAPNSAIAHTALGLLVWSPVERPTGAALYDAHCRKTATWQAGPATQ
jgi:hypothetical protein